jgi:hypothetical protein
MASVDESNAEAAVVEGLRMTFNASPDALSYLTLLGEQPLDEGGNTFEDFNLDLETTGQNEGYEGNLFGDGINGLDGLAKLVQTQS